MRNAESELSVVQQPEGFVKGTTSVVPQTPQNDRGL
jgi:hypothetical protein